MVLDLVLSSLYLKKASKALLKLDPLDDKAIKTYLNNELHDLLVEGNIQNWNLLKELGLSQNEFVRIIGLLDEKDNPIRQEYASKVKVIGAKLYLALHEHLRTNFNS